MCGFALRLLHKISKEKHCPLKRELVAYISTQPFFWKLALRECNFRAQKSSRCYYYFCFTGQCFWFLCSEKCLQLLACLLCYKTKSILYHILNLNMIFFSGKMGILLNIAKTSSNQQFCWQTVSSSSFHKGQQWIILQ